MATIAMGHAGADAAYVEKKGLWSWITTVDHKRIGILYGVTAFLFFLLGGLALSGYMSPIVAGGLMISYLMVVSEIYLAAYSVGLFRIHFLRLGPTELRILFAVGTLYLLRDAHTTVFGSRQLLFDVGGVCGIVGLVVTLLVSTVRNTRTLYLRETVR